MGRLAPVGFHKHGFINSTSIGQRHTRILEPVFNSTLTKLQVLFHKLTLKLPTLVELHASVAVKVKYAAQQYIYYVMYCISPLIFLIKDKL